MPDQVTERDYHQEYKDDLAAGRIWPDGSYREPSEPDWEAEARHRHCWEMHGGRECDCEPPEITASDDVSSEEPPF